MIKLSRRTVGYGIGPALISALAGCRRITRFDLRFRLIASVKLDGEIHTGSSVIAIRDYGSPSIGVGGSGGVEAHGQAIVIDLKKHGLLFGLINQPVSTAGFTIKQMSDYLNQMLPPETERKLRGDSYQRWIEFSRLKGDFLLPQEGQPVLVHFKDGKNVQSAQLVSTDTIASIYSTDAEILPSRVQIPCDEPTTYGIRRQLPPLGWGGLSLDHQPLRFSDQLSAGCFVADDFTAD